tara:strand:+ start:123 stop:431 length:309 start_codon:yes stop_codon:yes gene_type:complete
MKTIKILSEKEVIYSKVTEQFTIQLDNDLIMTLRFTSDDNGSEPILVWHEDEETWIELQEIIDELNLSSDDHEIIEELISSNLIQQYENDDVIDVKSELGIE